MCRSASHQLMAVPGSVIGVRKGVRRVILVPYRDRRHNRCGQVDRGRRESRIRSQYGDVRRDWDIVDRTDARCPCGHVLVGEGSAAIAPTLRETMAITAKP